MIRTTELPQQPRRDKIGYAIHARADLNEVWLHSLTGWTLINTFATRDDARAAVTRYQQARETAKDIGWKLWT